LLAARSVRALRAAPVAARSAFIQELYRPLVPDRAGVQDLEGAAGHGLELQQVVIVQPGVAHRREIGREGVEM
jgi:hypothetical protein